jgi:hypothetical protein
MSVAEKPDVRRATVQARCVRLPAKAVDAASISPDIETRAHCRAVKMILLIELKAAAVNPSDVKAATGLMPYAVFPRTPGPRLCGRRDRRSARLDWARKVSARPAISVFVATGTHATHLVVEAGSGGREAHEPFMGRGRRHRRALCHRDGRPAPRRHAQGWRDRAGDGRQRQGRAGGDADRDLARRARDRRGAQGRAV